MLSRALTLALVLAVGAGTGAADVLLHVCQMSGTVQKGCPCSEHPASDEATIAPEDTCCRVVVLQAAFESARLVERTDPTGAALLAALPPEPFEVLADDGDAGLAAPSQGPPRDDGPPLYLELRSFLI